jgi:Rieske Fe-S protein
MPFTSSDSPATTNLPERRSFFARVAAITVGTIAVIFPFAASFGVLLDPLRRHRRQASGDKSWAADFVRVCPLEALAADGTPQRFVVTADVTDAWTRTNGQRIGSVFLSREDAGDTPKVTAFNATCPHLGCAVEFSSAKDQFECPCHVSGFNKDGEKLFGPSLRSLDPLEVKLVDKNNTKEIWVVFQQFRAGLAERIPVA